MVVPSPKCKAGTQRSITTTVELTAQMSSERDPHLPLSQTQTRKGRKRSAEAQPPPPPPPTEEKSSSPSSSGRRCSARIKTLERAGKELLVRRRVELLEAKPDEEEEEGVMKPEGSGNTGVLGSDEKEQEQRPITYIASEGQQICKPRRFVAPDFGAEKSDHAKVKDVLRLFNTYYLQCVQEEETRCRKEEADRKASKSKAPKSKKGAKLEAAKHKAKRPDLKAISKMLVANETLYPEKRFGNIPGIEVGHQFFSRAEMVAVGFHSHWLNGIDYMGASYSNGVQEYSNYKFPLAVAIVLSGMYEDDLDNADNIVYTGQGGQNLTGNKRQIRDQKLERGNLALKNCIEQCVPVRVIRGHESKSSYCGKIYTYDGLYKVVQYWPEKGISGFTVFKYRLKRIEGQPVLTTNQVQFIYGRVPQATSEVRGLVCEDITGGLEDIPVPATNLVDDPPFVPAGYTYFKDIKVAKNVKVPSIAMGCNCEGSCVDPKTCSCAKLNGSDFPYVDCKGCRLIEAKDVVFECGPSCGCGPSCVNRTSQRGLKYRLEVFRTPAKGWAVRSWDFIPSGAPVCEYVGILRKTEDVDAVSGNDYIFDIDCLQTMKGLGGRERRSREVSMPEINSLDKLDDQRGESVPEYCIDAGSVGNVARFINHSCAPNLFVQCVLSCHHDIKLARIMLFAADNIPPLQELTYDYGYALNSVLGPDGKVRKMACYCGATDCRKRLF